MIQAEALNALQNLTDKLSHRNVMRQDCPMWDDAVLAAMATPELEKMSVTQTDENGFDSRVVVEVRGLSAVASLNACLNASHRSSSY